MISTPFLLCRGFAIICRIFPITKSAVYVLPLVDLQMCLETFLLGENLSTALRVWTRRRMRRPHMGLEFRPGGEEW